MALKPTHDLSLLQLLLFFCDGFIWYRRWVGGIWHGYYRHPLPHTTGEWCWYHAFPDTHWGRPPDVIECWPPAPQARALKR